MRRKKGLASGLGSKLNFNPKFKPINLNGSLSLNRIPILNPNPDPDPNPNPDPCPNRDPNRELPPVVMGNLGEAWVRHGMVYG